MNIHHLAAILVRIAGIVLLLKSIELVVSIAMAGATNFVGQPGYVAFLTFQVMWLTAGILFLLFPTRIAGNLMPAAPAEVTDQDNIPVNTLTCLIIIAAGLYFLIDGIKDLASFFTYWVVYVSQGYGQGLDKVSFWQPNLAGQLAPSIVSLVAGLWLLLKPQRIVDLIHRLRRAHPDQAQ